MGVDRRSARRWKVAGREHGRKALRAKATPSRPRKNELARLLLAERLPDDGLLNVNVPEAWNGRVRFTRQSQRITRSVLREELGVRCPSFWVQEISSLKSIDADCDSAALQAGEASLTPLYVHRTHQPSLNHLSPPAARLEALLGSR